MDSIPEASKRVAAAAAHVGMAIEVTEFPAGTKTAPEAAAAVGCELAAIVKSLVFMVDDRPVVALLPGDLRLSPAKLAAAAGGEAARRASLEEARRATGFAPGGTPPFGYPAPLPVYYERRLERHRQLWAAAGTPRTVFAVDFGSLVEAAGAVAADLAEDSAGGG